MEEGTNGMRFGSFSRQSCIRLACTSYSSSSHRRLLGRWGWALDMPEKLSVARQPAEPLSSRSDGADHLSIVHRHNGDNHGLSVVERSPLLSGILAGDYTIISAAARVKEFPRGEMVYAEGDSVQHVLVLTSGFAKITQLGPGGTEVILRFCVPGDVLGAVGLFSNGRHYTTAQAFRPCRALVWDAVAFKDGPCPRRGLAGTPGAVPRSSHRESCSASRTAAPAITRKNGPAGQWPGRGWPVARRIGANDRHHVVYRKPAPVSLGSGRDRKASP